MSTGSFDEETFLTETLQNTSSEFSIPETSNNANKRIDVSELMTKTLEKSIEFQTKSNLDFNESETPRNSSQPKRHKKRRNLSARCLSTDPNYDSSYSRVIFVNNYIRVFNYFLFRMNNIQINLMSCISRPPSRTI